MNVYHYSPGPVDLDALTTFGVSAKLHDNSIGKFGTGFKNALAIILRNGGDVRIHNVDGTIHEFGVKRKQIRSSEFDIVTLGGNQLAFATNLGAHWEMWMAYRELHSNALDEGGNTSSEFVPGMTNVTVSLPAYFEVHQNRRDYFIQEDEGVIYENEYLQILEGDSDTMFYQGIKVGRFPFKVPGRVNIKRDVELTEDRTAHGAAFYYLVSYGGLNGVKAKDPGTQPLTEFVHEMFHRMAIGDIREHVALAKGMITEAVARDRFENMLPLQTWVKSDVLDKINEERGNEKHQANVSQAKKLQRACDALQRMGYDVEPDDIEVVKSLGDGVLGTYRNGRITLSSLAFERGHRDLIKTLMEEHFHKVSGCSDFTRGFQEFLLEQILDQASI